MKMKTRKRTSMSLAAAVAASLALSAASSAATLLNPSFEGGSGGPDFTQNPANWNATSTAFRPRTFAPGTPSNINPTDGGFQAWMNNGTAGWQDTGDAIVAGTTYQLKIDLNADQLNFPNIETTVIRFYGSDAGTGTALAEITPNGPATSVWTEQTLAFTATAGQATGQTLGVYLGVTSGTQVEWDNIRLTATPIPEPSAAAFLALGGLALLRRRRK